MRLTGVDAPEGEGEGFCEDDSSEAGAVSMARCNDSKVCEVAVTGRGTRAALSAKLACARAARSCSWRAAACSAAERGMLPLPLTNGVAVPLVGVGMILETLDGDDNGVDLTPCEDGASMPRPMGTLVPAVGVTTVLSNVVGVNTLGCNAGESSMRLANGTG
jgi:hypothetical protein